MKCERLLCLKLQFIKQQNKYLKGVFAKNERGYRLNAATDATDRSKISSDQKRFFIALSLYPLSFFANTPFKDHF